VRQNCGVSFRPHEATPADLERQLAAERAGSPFLVYRDGANAQQLVTLAGDRASVGRAPEHEIVLGWDTEASRVHAVLERLGGSWTVIDDDLSRNGTFVNGTRVRGRRRLSDRDVIRFGSTSVLYRDPGEVAGETAPPAEAATAVQITAAQQRVLVALCRPLAQPTGGAPSSNREIAAELTVSVEAVRSQLKTLFKLFGVPDLHQNAKRAELAKRAMASGVVSPRDLAG
jgi:hypothetical protein